MDTGLQAVEYAAFEDRVKRTIYLDNLSPQATEPVIRWAFKQFGAVNSVKFIPNYVKPGKIPCCALVEMEKETQAEHIISQMATNPFMISGMPRPVRGCAAQAEMFDDRPTKPGRKIHLHWLDPNHPDFKVANKLKQLTRKHAAEAAFSLKNLLEDEEKLAKQQAVALKATYKKYEKIDGTIADKSAPRLARHYNMNIRDE